MYIKIVRNSEMGGETMQVKRFSYGKYEQANTEPGLRVVCDEAVKLFPAEDPVTIYVMNDNGQTIDKIVWDYYHELEA